MKTAWRIVTSITTLQKEEQLVACMLHLKYNIALKMEKYVVGSLKEEEEEEEKKQEEKEKKEEKKKTKEKEKKKEEEEREEEEEGH